MSPTPIQGTPTTPGFLLSRRLARSVEDQRSLAASQKKSPKNVKDATLALYLTEGHSSAFVFSDRITFII